MNLYKDIHQLIRENDCVIIPAFGGFVMNYFEAKIDFKYQEFCPPIRKVAFNENLINNDGLLLNFISNKYSISWYQAEKEVQKFVEEIKNKLNEEQILIFGNIGSFKKKNGLLEFTPNAKENFLDDSFGLHTFNYPMLKTTFSEQTITPYPKTKKNNNTTLWIIKSVAAAIAGLLFVTAQFDVFNSNKPNNNLNYSSFSSISKIVETNDEQTVQLNDTNFEEAQINNVENIVELPEYNENIETTNIITQELKNEKPQEEILEIKAHTIAGSFFDSENAEKLQQELISKGFSAIVLPEWNGKYRVSIKSYSTKQNAINDLENIRTLSNIKDLWVLYV